MGVPIFRVITVLLIIICMHVLSSYLLDLSIECCNFYISIANVCDIEIIMYW